MIITTTLVIDLASIIIKIGNYRLSMINHLQSMEETSIVDHRS